MTGTTFSALLSSTALALALPATAAAAAPAAPATQDDNAITVTARKQKEDILTVPVTVQAMTSAQLEQRGIASVTGVVAASPGINVNNASSGRSDRSFQQISLRGFTPQFATVTTVAMFIDGVAVSSPSQLTSITDPAQIEVLKGPQSAFFGRNTFAGAINVTNKEPSGRWGGDLMVELGNHAARKVQGSIEGGFLNGDIAFRLTGLYWTKDGTYRNYDGSTLGDQSSRNFTAMVVAKPTSDLTIKLFGMMGRDDDGISAQTRILAYNVTANADGTGAVQQVSQANCSFANASGTGTHPWICGTLPAYTNAVGSNAVMTDTLRTRLANRTLLKSSDLVDHFGLLRNSQHAHGVIDYKFSQQLNLQLLAGYNHETYSSLIDLDGFGTSSFNWPYEVDRWSRDWSTEGRLNYKFGNLRGVVGASYLSAQTQGALGSYADTFLSYSVSGRSATKTFGAFFSATYDVTPQLSGSFEGRYQIDTIAAYQSATPYTATSANLYITPGYYAAGALLGEKTFRNFLPRAMLSYQFSKAAMVYLSWSKGVNPSSFNSGVVTQSQAVQTAAQAAGVKLYADPEKVTNYEIGAKGKLLDGRLRYTASLYYAQWKNQINSTNFPYYSATGSILLASANLNTGNADMYGAEANLTYKVNDLITVDAAAAYTGSRIITYANALLTALYATSNFYGKEMGGVSKYSANMGVTFGGDIKGLDDATWFLRTDWNFKSGVWIDAANVTRTPDQHLFNTRLGMTKGRYSASVYVNNIFNNHTVSAATSNYTYNSTSSYFSQLSAIQLGLPELRSFGVQLKVKM
ncbi:TonB-dependent receptor [Novosphingobium sp. FSY-8]|uniref:TonB-dependent receptor n=1 Tax=Novosphingobium ovatum TaxID=1908523 RepID=A0ABW9X985_9SPHN|nr:TonB-dependent receptor [Novosphingobium ovatum]NBC35075.1 TonB-dependent receptor [Novosphingobium ovatum]